MSDREHAVFPAGQGRGPTNPYRPFRFAEIEQSIPARFAQQVAAFPDKIAVATATSQLTYAELAQATTRLARAIVEQRGHGAEPVAFLVKQGCPQIVAMLGILKAGKIYVALDPNQPPARNAAVLEDAQAPLLVTDRANLSLAPGLAGRGCRLLNLEDLAGFAATSLQLDIAPDRPANIIYTSGSTGKVKGLVHSHRNVLHTTLKYTNNLHISDADRLVLLYSCAFAGSVADIFAALLNGATLLPFNLKEEGIRHLGRWLADKQVTLYQSVPTVFRQFVETLDASERFPHLRLLRLGGEAVTLRDVELHRKHFPPECLLAVSLGASEILGIRLFFVDQDAPLPGPRVPVGYALQDTEVRILNEKGEAAEPGSIGAMEIRSPYLALGYWRDPELTRTFFRSDPQRPEARTLRIGDLGKLHPDGCLEYVGRADFQIKVRGHRVEAAEVEMALLAIANVKDAVVVGRESVAGDQRLVAYVVPVNRPGPTVSRMRLALHEVLPEYMIPSAFVFLDELPTTPAGKVDRLALPAPDASRPALRSPYIPPTDPLQILLVEVWEDCLNVRPIGIRDNFFELGGDSILAMDMALRLESHCGRRLPPGALLGASTIELLARVLLLREADPACPPVVEVQAGGRERSLFFCHGDFNGGGVYCVPLARHLDPERPFHAVHPHGLSTNEVPATIEEMARDRLRIIRTIQPQGPYALGGHCNGGLVAYEMAQQLVRERERVDFLVLVAPPPGVRVESAEAATLPGDTPEANGRGPVDMAGLVPEQRRACLIFAYRDVCGRYVMRPFPGKFVIVLPINSMDAYGSPERWRHLAGPANVHLVPGGHLTILSGKFLHGLAAVLRESRAAP